MSVVKINALQVSAGSGAELEERFSARKRAVDRAPGFEGFQLLRPTAGESRYFVVTTWATEADFQAWLSSREPRDPNERSVITGMELLEFETVDLPDPTG